MNFSWIWTNLEDNPQTDEPNIPFDLAMQIRNNEDIPKCIRTGKDFVSTMEKIVKALIQTLG